MMKSNNSNRPEIPQYPKHSQSLLQEEISRNCNDAIETEMLLKADQEARKGQAKDYANYLRSQVKIYIFC